MKPVIGIPQRGESGDLSKLSPGDLVKYFVQKHDADRRGVHYDFRIGTPDTGLFSWAFDKNPTTGADKKINGARTDLHSYDYGDWSGTIPKGYGKGKVTAVESGNAIVTRKTDRTLSLTLGDRKEPKRITLLHPGPKYGDKFWQLINKTLPAHPEVQKTKYRNVGKADAEKELKGLPEGSIVQPKIDGALQLLLLGKNKIELLSHRKSQQGGKAIVHTERVFHTAPHVDIPKALRNSVLLAEVYASKDDKVLPPATTSGLLNSTVTKSIKDQKEKGIELKAMLFGTSVVRNKPFGFEIPYEKRKDVLRKVVELLPGKFHLPDEIRDPAEAKKLFSEISKGKHPMTSEGVVVHPTVGVPTKIKAIDEHDVYVHSFFPGEGRLNEKGVGGFYYSYTPNGAIAGRVGTGFSDSLRADMLKNPKDYIGRKARLHAQEKFNSGALRAPSLISLHEG